MIYRIIVPGIALNTYVIVDPTTRRAAVIDPSRAIQPILKIAAKADAQIVAILETHIHADFISGSEDLSAALENKAAVYRSSEGSAVGNVKDRQNIELGSYTLQAWHTPGHTPEHLMWILLKEGNPTHAFTGDFLFVGSVGRPDLLGEQAIADLASQLYHSIFEVLPQLDENIQVWPAHGAGSLCGKGISTEASTTIKNERIHNPYLQPLPKDEWVRFVLKDMPKAPAYFSRMKRINAAQSLAEVAEAHNNAVIVDLRSKEEFAEKHIPGSINIGFGPSFIQWAPVLLPFDRPLMLIANDKPTINEASEALHLVGMDAPIYGKLWKEEHEGPFDSLTVLGPAVVRHFPKGAVLLDVRSNNEVKETPVAGALHIPLNELPSRVEEVPQDKPIIVMCHSGHRASIGASFLQNRDFRQVSAIFGVMTN
jgi:hydroxyacylglutathione hydrolase